MLRCAVAIALLVSCVSASCPFRRQAERAKNPSDPFMQRALQEASKGAFCGPPLCEPSKNGRRLLSEATVGANGYPTLAQTTVDAIEASFCTLVDTATGDGTCSVTAGLGGGQAGKGGKGGKGGQVGEGDSANEGGSGARCFDMCFFSTG